MRFVNVLGQRYSELQLRCGDPINTGHTAVPSIVLFRFMHSGDNSLCFHMLPHLLEMDLDTGRSYLSIGLLLPYGSPHRLV